MFVANWSFSYSNVSAKLLKSLTVVVLLQTRCRAKDDRLMEERGSATLYAHHCSHQSLTNRPTQVGVAEKFYAWLSRSSLSISTHVRRLALSSMVYA